MALTLPAPPPAPTAAQYRAWQLQKAKLHIEEHLAEPLSIRRLAEVSHYSYHRFHHLFTDVEHEPVGNFVQRVRLERGAYLLRHSGWRVADIAEVVGYASGAAFSKAFAHHFGGSPSVYRAAGTNRPVTSARGRLGNYAAPRIVHAPPLSLLCARQQGPARHPRAWAALTAAVPPGSPPAAYIGKTPDFPGITPAGQLRYDACWLLPAEAAPPVEPPYSVHRQTIDGGRFAVLDHQGSAASLGASFQVIHQNWLPESGYRLRNAPWYQRYRRAAPNEQSVTEIYVPIA
ncbi:AraC family transcriptional regulator [Hymenobacter sp.]|uniref:AraC family transcriptional regulator n=1 Tax=Hymenobacter sp. TaxID=1898978 RepID=UPI00286CB0E4|nr:AraC family transcriptional regulator [Hymenobacter sp.]